jgi:hypothetical protein
MLTVEKVADTLREYKLPLVTCSTVLATGALAAYIRSAYKRYDPALALFRSLFRARTFVYSFARPLFRSLALALSRSLSLSLLLL